MQLLFSETLRLLFCSRKEESIDRMLKKNIYHSSNTSSRIAWLLLCVTAGLSLEVKPQNLVPDWSFDNPIYSEHVTSGVSNTLHSSGNRRLTMRLERSVDEAERIQSAVVHSLNEVKTGEFYEFSAWVKADNLHGESLIRVLGRSSFHPNQTPISVGTAYGPSGYSSWMSIALTVVVPDNVHMLMFTLEGRAAKQGCNEQTCGRIQFDNVLVTRLENPDSRAQLQAISNVCPNDEFLDIRTEQCRKLDKRFGYTAPTSVGARYIHLECNETNAGTINKAIESFRNQGGILKLAPCEVELDDEILLASNVTLRGSGSGRTRLVRTPNWSKPVSTLLRVEGNRKSQIENVVLQDFSIKGSGPLPSEMNNIQIRYANNILVERIETFNAGKSGVTLTSSQNSTIRYVTAHDSVLWHGIASKDCYLHPSLDSTDANELVDRNECSLGYEKFYTKDVSLHSNITFNNSGLGIDSHASYAEIAGNDMNHNGAASKFPEPAQNIWVHHNQFSNSRREGTKVAIQQQYGDEDLVPYNQVYYSNSFINNADYGIRIHERARDIVLINNHYRNNGRQNKLRIVPGESFNPRVYICEGDDSTIDGLDGPASALKDLNVADTRCDLSHVADIFSNED